MTSLRPFKVLFLASILLACAWPATALSVAGSRPGPAASPDSAGPRQGPAASPGSAGPRQGPAASPDSAGPETAPVLAAGRDTVYYMNKTGNTPNVDGTWDAANWARGRVYDVSNGQGRCFMYIMFTALQGTSTRIFIGLDVRADVSDNTAGNEYLEIGLDGENDGIITYTDQTGLPEDVVLPLTFGGPCKDRWAQITGWNLNDAGWINMDGTTNTPTRWRVTGGGENTDQMAAGFSGHRFYEYSMDYNRELALSSGASSIFGLNFAVYDALNAGSLLFPGNRNDISGPWVQFALAQAPVANVNFPLNGGTYYQNESIDFDAAGTTDDDLAHLTYLWTFDDGATASTAAAPHKFLTLGQHTATLQVTDADGLNDTKLVTFNIKEKNEPPVITSFFPPTEVAVLESETVTFGVNITDANLDVKDILTINWTVDGTRVKTGLFPGGAGYTFKTNYDGQYSAGTYIINASVQDNYDGGSPEPTVQSWTVNVHNNNRAPVITTVSPDVDQVSMPENSSRDFSLAEYSDPDGDRLLIQWYLDNETLPGTKDREIISFRTDFNSSGTHELKVAVTDRPNGSAARTSEKIWQLIVTNVNRAPVVSSAAPSQQEVSVQEGRELLFTIMKSDPDGDALAVQWFLDTEPLAGSNSTSFTFRAAFEGPLSAEGSPYQVKAVVKDGGGLAAERTWELTVEDVNRLPVAIIDEPAENAEFRLGATVKFRGDRSWDPDTADNGSLQYSWDFGDGKTGTGPSGSHKYDKTGYYTVRLSVRDRAATSTAVVHLTVRAPILWVTDVLLVPTVNVREEKPVNITVLVSNTGDADAQNVRIRISLDGASVATLSLGEIAAGEKKEVGYTWPAVKGEHIIRASIEPAADIIVPEESSSQKTVLVKGRLPPAKASTSAFMLGLAGAAVAAVALAVLGYIVVSRRKKPARAPAARAPGGALSPDAALAALTNAPAGELPPPGGGVGLPEGGMVSAPPPEEAAPPASDSAQSAAPAPAAPAEAVGPDIGPAAAPASEAPPAGEPALVAAASAGPKCLSCGEAVDGSWKTCPACGVRLGEAPERTEEPAPAPEAPPSPLLCPGCSSPVEKDWKVCAECGSKLEPAGGDQATPAPEGAAGAPDAGAGFTDAAADIRKRMDVLQAMDKDVSQVQSTLELASSFHRTGKGEKAQKYLEKAQALIEELDRA